MKQKLVGSITLSIIAMLFLSMMSILPALALPPEIYMDPTANNFTTGPPGVVHAPGYRWNITVYAKDATDPLFKSYQVDFTVDDSMLVITGAWLPNWDPLWAFVGRTTMFPLPAFHDFNLNGYFENVWIGDAIIVGPAASGGKLAIIELEILKAPGKFEPPLTCPLRINTIDTYLLDSEGAEITPIIKTDGSYSFSWNPPTTMPHLAVSPTLVTFGPDPPSAIGQAFDIEVRIKNLDLGWGITAAMLDLNFNTTVIDVVGGIANVTINTFDWDGPYSITITHADPDTVSIFVSTTKSLSGNVLVATVKFTVMMQQETPPYPMSWFDYSDLTFCFSMLEDHFGPIPTDEPEVGLVKVFVLRTLPIAWISLDPEDTVLGPDLVVGPQFGQEFVINVNINELEAAWRLIGLQTKLTFDSDLMEVVSVEEGPFLPSFPEPGQIPPTWFVSYVEIDGPWGDYIEFADLKLSTTGIYTNFPEGSGTVAIIRFRAIKQSWVTPLTHQFVAWDCLGVDDDVKDVPIIGGDVGTYTVLAIGAVGRRIDLWMQYPSPYGGQGLNQPCDLVIPQQEIYLTAKVTYNWYPVEDKKVTFEVRDNHGYFQALLSDVTDADGHAYASYRMPAEIESLFGVWTITASVSVAEVVVIDTMQFHFDDLVRIWSVTTDKVEYEHLDTVKITVSYGTHAIQTYWVLITSTIKDELDVPRGIAATGKVVGGSVFCQYKNFVSVFYLQIPHNAYAGLAHVHTNVLTHWPSYGGTAVTWENVIGFHILPY